MGEEQSTGNEPLLTIKELSERSRLSISTLHRLKSAGKIPFYQPAGKNGRLLFPLDAIERLAIAGNTAGPTNVPTGGRPRGHLSGSRPAWMQQINPKTQEN